MYIYTYTFKYMYTYTDTTWATELYGIYKANQNKP